MKLKKICALVAALSVVCMMTACGKTEEKSAETTAPVNLPAAAAQVKDSVGTCLEDWTMTPSTWSSPNGATIQLVAVPDGHAEGETAEFVVRLGSKEIERVDCEWANGAYIASVDLNAADGLCYYVVLTAPDGVKTEIPVNTPEAMSYDYLVNLETALDVTCSLTIESAEIKDNQLVIGAGTAQVQLARILGDGEKVTCTEADLVLSNGSEILEKKAITLSEEGATGACTADVSGVALPLPAMEEGQQVILQLNATLSDGRIISADGGMWQYSGGELAMAVG